MPGWMKHKLESSLLGKISITSDTTFMTENKEELKSLLIKVKEESEKADLKLNILKMKIMANRWGNNGNSDRLSSLGLQNHSRW